MGLFDKVKAMKNAVTGGAAEVQIEVGEAELGEAIPVRVTATAKSDLKIDRVYLKVRAREEAVVDDIDVFVDGAARREQVHGRHETADIEITIAEGAQLEDGQSYTWEGSFELDEDDHNPSFDGEIIRHTWQIQAGLDAFGNDPDSGWVDFWVD